MKKELDKKEIPSYKIPNMAKNDMRLSKQGKEIQEERITESFTKNLPVNSSAVLPPNLVIDNYSMEPWNFNKLKSYLPYVVNYNVKLNDELGGNVVDTLGYIYQDRLPSSVYGEGFSTIESRLTLQNYFRNIILNNRDEEIIEYMNSTYSCLLSSIKPIEANPHTYSSYSNNPYKKNKAMDLAIVKSGYPIRYIGNGKIELAEKSVVVNLRIHRLLKIHMMENMGIQRKNFNCWRELEYYRYVTDEIVSKNENPHFVILYGWKMLKRNIPFNKLNATSKTLDIRKYYMMFLEKVTKDELEQYANKVFSGNEWFTPGINDNKKLITIQIGGNDNNNIRLIDDVYNGQGLLFLFNNNGKSYLVTVKDKKTNLYEDIGGYIYKSNIVDDLQLKLSKYFSLSKIDIPISTELLNKTFKFDIMGTEGYKYRIFILRINNKDISLLPNIKVITSCNNLEKNNTISNRLKLILKELSHKAISNLQTLSIFTKQIGGTNEDNDENIEVEKVLEKAMRGKMQLYKEQKEKFLRDKDKIISNGFKEHNFKLMIITESFNLTFIDWSSRQYSSSSPLYPIKDMIHSGIFTINIWYSIIFQIVLVLCSLQFHKIAFRKMSLISNFVIRELDVERGSFWEYIIDGISYYLPNDGYLLLCDTDGKEIMNIKSTELLDDSDDPLTNLTDSYKIIMYHVDRKKKSKTNKTTINNELEIKNKINLININNAIKIFSPIMFDVVEVRGQVNTPPREILCLLEKIQTEIIRQKNENEINKKEYIIDYGSILRKFFTKFYHPRIGTLLTETELKYNKPTDSSSTIISDGIAIYREDENKLIWVITTKLDDEYEITYFNDMTDETITKKVASSSLQYGKILSNPENIYNKINTHKRLARYFVLTEKHI